MNNKSHLKSFKCVKITFLSENQEKTPKKMENLYLKWSFLRHFFVFMLAKLDF